MEYYLDNTCLTDLSCFPPKTLKSGLRLKKNDFFVTVPGTLPDNDQSFELIKQAISICSRTIGYCFLYGFWNFLYFNNSETGYRNAIFSEHLEVLKNGHVTIQLHSRCTGLVTSLQIGVFSFP